MKSFKTVCTQLVLLVGALLFSQAYAENPAVFKYTVEKPIAEVYPAMGRSFDDSRFFVLKEINIGNSLSGFAEKWGDDYNRNKLTAIRSMVFCNGWYANRVSNLDPDLLGLCPLHLTLIEKQGHSTALFNRPTAIAGDSPAYELLAEIEQEVIAIIKKGMQ